MPRRSETRRSRCMSTSPGSDVQRMVDTAVGGSAARRAVQQRRFGGPHVKLADTDEDLLRQAFLGMNLKGDSSDEVRGGPGRDHQHGVASALVGWKGLSCYAAAKAGRGPDDEVGGTGLRPLRHPHQCDLPGHDLHRTGGSRPRQPRSRKARTCRRRWPAGATPPNWPPPRCFWPAMMPPSLPG